MASQVIARHTIAMVGANSSIIRDILPVSGCWWLLVCFQGRFLPSAVAGSTVFTLMLVVRFTFSSGVGFHVIGFALAATCLASFAAAPTMSIVVSIKADTPSAIKGFAYVPSRIGPVPGRVLSDSGMLGGCRIVNGWWCRMSRIYVSLPEVSVSA